MSCTNSTQAYGVDVEHQPNGVGSQLVGVVIAGVWLEAGRWVSTHISQRRELYP